MDTDKVLQSFSSYYTFQIMLICNDKKLFANQCQDNVKLYKYAKFDQNISCGKMYKYAKFDQNIPCGSRVMAFY